MKAIAGRRWLGVTPIIATVFITQALAATNEHGPYAGWQHRDIKALSRQQVDDLLNGRGMSLALAAELNGFPGPKHVLEHAVALQLEPAQLSHTRTLMRRMKAEATSLGREIVDLEASLDRFFATSTVDEKELARILRHIATARGNLRLVHLKYHLAMRALLSKSQITKYRRLRGYDRPARPRPNHHRSHQR